MIQKWRPLPRILSSSSQSESCAPSSSFHPRLSFAASIYRPFSYAPATPNSPPPAQDFPRPRLSRNPNFQNSFSHIKSLCFRCGGEGHIARSCNFPVKCFHCGAFGHKRPQCRKLKNLKSVQGSSIASSTGVDDDSWILRSTRSETSMSVDCLLLDPDVAGCLDNKILDLNDIHSSPGEFDGLQLNHSVPGIDLSQEQGRLRPKVHNFYSGTFISEMLMVLEKGRTAPLVSSFKLRSRQCILPGKGKRFDAHYRLRTSIKQWDIHGRMDLVSYFATYFQKYPPRPTVNSLKPPISSLMNEKLSQSPISSDNPLLLEDFRSRSHPELNDTDKGGNTKIELARVPFSVISSFVILDDLRSSSMAPSLDEVHKGTRVRARGSSVLPSFIPETKKKKVPSSKKVQVMDLPIYVRRSPRFFCK